MSSILFLFLYIFCLIKYYIALKTIYILKNLSNNPSQIAFENFARLKFTLCGKMLL